MSVHTAYCRRDLGTDWIGSKDTLVEVHLSEAQWAAMVSSFGQGSGTPCTLTYIAGKGQLPPMPDPESVATKFADDQKINQSDTVIRLKKAEAILERMLAAGAKPTKKEIEEAKSDIGIALNGIDQGHFNFVTKRMTERMEHLVTEAKIEVEAYVASKLMALGIDALHRGEGIIELPGSAEGNRT
jgi:hypothetical protein